MRIQTLTDFIAALDSGELETTAVQYDDDCGLLTVEYAETVPDRLGAILETFNTEIANHE